MTVSHLSQRLYWCGDGTSIAGHLDVQTFTASAKHVRPTDLKKGLLVLSLNVDDRKAGMTTLEFFRLEFEWNYSKTY